MSLCTAADIKILAKEFANVEIPVIDFFIARAEEEIDPAAWGSRAGLACMWLTCHLMTVGGVTASGGGAGGAAGPVTGVTVGDVSVSYANAGAVMGANLDASLSSTRYGVEYARLIKLAAMGAALAVED